MAHRPSPDLVDRFEREVLVHVDAAYRMAITLTGDRDRAEDLVQDATLKALRSFGGVDHARNLRSWFVRVVHTTFLDGIRYERRRPTESIDADDGPAEHELGSVQLVPEVFRAGLDDDYEAALAELPPGWRAVVHLVDIEGQSYEEAAKALDLPVGTVRSRLHRARERLLVSLCRRLRLAGCPEEVGGSA